MARSPYLTFDALIIGAILAIVSKSLALRASMKIVTLVGMIAVKFLRNGSLFSILMDGGVLLFEVLYDPFSYEMRGDIIRDDGEFRGISDGMDDAMSNGGGDGGSENNVKAEDISVLVSEFVF